MIFYCKDTGDGFVELRFAYDPRFITLLKDEIPRECRGWDSEERVWRIDINYLTTLRVLCEHCGRMEWESAEPGYYRATSARSAADPHAADFAVLHLLPTAPEELLRAAYRTLALKHHPDVGGDEGRMKSITGAYSRLSDVLWRKNRD